MAKTAKQHTDESLVEGCVANDRYSQELLFRKYFPSMMRMCRRYTQDPEVAMEIINTGFLRVFKKIHTYAFTGSLEGWIRKLVFHSLSDYFSKQAKQVNLLDLADRDAPESALALQSLYFEDIIRLIDYLPDATRQVFWMYAVEGYTHPEISDRIGISVGTSKWHLSMARQKLRTLIENHYPNTKYHAG